MILTLLSYEWKRHAYHGREWLYFGVFLCIMLICFSIVLSGDNSIISQSLLPIIWIGILLSVLFLSAGGAQQEREQGMVEQFIRLPLALEKWVCAKLLVQWGLSGAVLVGLLPIIDLVMSSNMANIQVIVRLLIGHWSLIAIAYFSAILASVSHMGRFLLPLIMLPTAIPILIFGSGASKAVITSDISVTSLLVAVGFIMTPLCVLGCGVVLRTTSR